MNFSKSLLFLVMAGVSTAAMTAEAVPAAPAPSEFVNKAAQDGMTEVALGKVALSKSKDPKVQDFAQRMVTDHGKANAELASLAKAKGIEPPNTLDAIHEAMVQQLQGKDGAEFDHAYAQHMNMDHGKAIELFESAAKSADADVAGFARKTLPTLKEHKILAVNLAAKQ